MVLCLNTSRSRELNASRGMSFIPKYLIGLDLALPHKTGKSLKAKMKMLHVGLQGAMPADSHGYS